MERPNEPASGYGGDRASDQRTAVGEVPYKHDLVPIDEAPEDVAPDNVASEDVAPDNVPSEDVTSGDVASEDVASGDVASEDVVSGDVASGDMSSEDVAPGDVVSGDVAFERVASGDLGSEDVGSADVAFERVASGDVGSEDVGSADVAFEDKATGEVKSGDLVFVAENTASSRAPGIDAKCKEKDLTITKLREDIKERDRRESDVLTEFTLLMNNYASLDQTLAAVKEMNIEYVRKIEEQVRELSALQATVGALRCRETEREERVEALKQKQLTAMECGVCLCVFLKPVTLSCGHTFCQKCSKDVQGAASRVGSSAKCPLCREPTRHEVRPAVLDELSEIIRDLETKACSLS